MLRRCPTVPAGAWRRCRRGGLGSLLRHDECSSAAVAPVEIWEHTLSTCPQIPGEMANEALWQSLFLDLHRSEHVDTGYLFTPAHWKYTGNHILAEAIFTGLEKTFPYGVVTGDTWLVMLHQPGH